MSAVVRRPVLAGSGVGVATSLVTPVFGSKPNDMMLKRGVHHSIGDLKADIAEFIKARNDDPKPFIWTKTADAIVQTTARYCFDILATHVSIT